MATLGTNTPYSSNDILSYVATNVAGAAVLNISAPGGSSHSDPVNATAAVSVIGGVYATTPTANASGDVVRLWLDAQGYNIPHREYILLGSFSTLGSATTTTSPTAAGFGAFYNMIVAINMTTATGAVATLNVLVDSQVDGTNWYNICQTPIMTASGSFVVNLVRAVATSGMSTTTVDAGVGTFRTFGWGDNIRARLAVSGTATTQIGAQIYINVF